MSLLNLVHSQNEGTYPPRIAPSTTSSTTEDNSPFYEGRHDPGTVERSIPNHLRNLSWSPPVAAAHSTPQQPQPTSALGISGTSAHFYPSSRSENNITPTPDAKTPKVDWHSHRLLGLQGTAKCFPLKDGKSAIFVHTTSRSATNFNIYRYKSIVPTSSGRKTQFRNIRSSIGEFR